MCSGTNFLVAMISASSSRDLKVRLFSITSELILEALPAKSIPITFLCNFLLLFCY